MVDTTIQTAAAEIAALVDDVSSPPTAPNEEINVSHGPRDFGYDVDEINEEHALVLLGGKALVVREQPLALPQDRLRFLTIGAIQAWYENKLTEVRGADGKIKTVTWARRWMGDRARRSYEGVEFFPNPDGATTTPGYLNLWRGFSVEPTERGTWNIFRDHLLNNVCRGDDALYNFVFGWIAHMIQRPRERIGTSLVLRGQMGTGKSKIGEVIGSLIPSHYFPVDDPRYITGQFNAHMACCLLLQADEAVWAGDKAAEGRLKGLVTSEYQMIENKGVDAIRVKNFVRLMMTSNEDWVVPAGKDERRFCVLDIDPRCAKNNAYFREMDEELDAGGRGRLLFDLQHFDLESVSLREIPLTRALLDQKILSLDPITSWWYSRLIDGTPTRAFESWPSQVRTSVLYHDYVKTAEEAGTRHKREPEFGIKLAKLVPGIERVRGSRVEEEPGVVKRRWCYVLPGLEACREAFQTQLEQSVPWPQEPSSDLVVSAIEPADEEIP